MNASQKCIIRKTKTFGLLQNGYLVHVAVTVHTYCNTCILQICRTEKQTAKWERDFVQFKKKRNYSFKTLSCLLYIYARRITEYIHRSHIKEFTLSNDENFRKNKQTMGRVFKDSPFANNKTWERSRGTFNRNMFRNNYLKTRVPQMYISFSFITY